METNQKIHEWLGKCWCNSNEIVTFDWPSRWTPCSKCGMEGPNPDYTTDPAASLELINALKAKGYRLTVRTDDDKSGMLVRFQKGQERRSWFVDANTLSMAVSIAVDQLIDMERYVDKGGECSF